VDLRNSSLKGKKVLVTGHTGFKGAWFSHLLHELGALVFGISLPPEGNKNLYTQAHISELMTAEYFIDIRNYDDLRSTLDLIRPEYVFHLAAQSLVLQSYRQPLDTFSTNILGTANLLEILLHHELLYGVTIVTTDKVYKNNEWIWPYRENEELGGKDPYSASKAAAEMIVHSLGSSFNKNLIPIATARAGNVVGGGDWAVERLVPDLVRAINSQTPIAIRYPSATRPWQHVLDCLYGYLLIADFHISKKYSNLLENYNFGPESSISVTKVIRIIESCYGLKINFTVSSPTLHEHASLVLDSTKARTTLGWLPWFSSEEAIRNTALWYQNEHSHFNAKELMRNEISRYLDSRQ
jgi:CDP-glucose 4,6-dehydratase